MKDKSIISLYSEDYPCDVLDKFASTVPMSPYLVAVAITDYVALPSPDNRWSAISTHYLSI